MDAETIVQRAKQKAASDNGRKRVRVIPLTYDRGILPYREALECRRQCGANTPEDLGEYIFKRRGIPSYIWSLPDGIKFLVVYEAARVPSAGGAVGRSREQQGKPVPEKKGGKQAERVTSPVPSPVPVPVQAGGEESFTEQYCHEIAGGGYAAILVLSFLLGVAANMTADAEGLYGAACVMGVMGLIALISFCLWLVYKARRYEEKGYR